MREIARRGRALADEVGQPQLGFTHQALSAWFSGMRNPRPGHRQLLAMIFGIPLEELNRGFDGIAFEQINANQILKPVIVEVHGNERLFEYKLTIRNDIDLDRPAVYRSWMEMFRPWPAPLIRHFGRLRYELYGWIPDRSVYPLVREPHSLVPLDPRWSLSEGADTVEKQIWFVYLSTGQLEVGFAFREGRSLVLAKAGRAENAVQRYPLSRVDLVGRVVGKTLLHLKAQ